MTPARAGRAARRRARRPTSARPRRRPTTCSTTLADVPAARRPTRCRLVGALSRTGGGRPAHRRADRRPGRRRRSASAWPPSAPAWPSTRRPCATGPPRCSRPASACGAAEERLATARRRGRGGRTRPRRRAGAAQPDRAGRPAASTVEPSPRATSLVGLARRGAGPPLRGGHQRVDQPPPAGGRDHRRGLRRPAGHRGPQRPARCSCRRSAIEPRRTCAWPSARGATWPARIAVEDVEARRAALRPAAPGRPARSRRTTVGVRAVATLLDRRARSGGTDGVAQSLGLDAARDRRATTRWVDADGRAARAPRWCWWAARSTLRRAARGGRAGGAGAGGGGAG